SGCCSFRRDRVRSTVTSRSAATTAASFVLVLRAGAQRGCAGRAVNGTVAHTGTMATTWTDGDPVAHIDAVPSAVRRRDARTLCDLMERVTGVAPRMFGSSMIGFGEYRYEYESGHAGHAPAAAFAP